MFLTILCTVLFLGADILTEFGVYSSPKCKVVSQTGSVTISNDTSNSRWDEHRQLVLGRVSIISQMQSLRFLEDSWNVVPSGFPAYVTPSTCIQCLDTPTRPPMLKDCRVEDGRVYAAGELSIGLHRPQSLLNTVAVGFNETAAGGRHFFVDGDLVLQNLDQCAIFGTYVDNVDKPSGETTVTYFEYSLQDHCDGEIRIATRERPDVVQWFETKGPTYTQRITCAESRVLPATLREAIMLYRTVQLEYSLHLQAYDEEKLRFEKLSENDVYRAVLGAMLANTQFKDGEFYEYAECGLYEWVYLAPFLISLGCLGFLAAFAYYFSAWSVPNALVNADGSATRARQEGSERKLPIDDGMMEEGEAGQGSDSVLDKA